MLVHIGYHKTATTWLQRSVFDVAPGFQRPWSVRDLGATLVRPHDLVFDAAEARRRLAEQRSCPPRPDVVDVASAEGLSGNPHVGGFNSRTIADRLHETVSDARILIVIREQTAMVASTYKQYVRAGGPLPLSAYLAPTFRPIGPRFDWAHFAFDRLIAHYHERFGADSVLVLPYEQLAADRAGFVQAIGAFAGADVGDNSPALPINVSVSAAGCAVKRQMNRFLRTALNPSGVIDSQRRRQDVVRVTAVLDRSLPSRLRAASDRRLHEAVAAAIADRFAASNRRTAELTGLDLANLGYDVGPAAGSQLEPPTFSTRGFLRARRDSNPQPSDP